ncbi:MAG: TonB family protein [Rickettsiales bacterium]|nr:TonB family protein [Rickettsiales bacterium]
MALAITPKTLMPSNIGIGNNVYLGSSHFWKMFFGAVIFHAVLIAIIMYWPREEVVEIPVRTLSLKLGGGPAFELPQLHETPFGEPQPRVENPVLEELEALEVPVEPVAAVANKPVEPFVSAPTTQNLADLDMSDVDWPKSKAPKPVAKKEAPKPVVKKEKPKPVKKDKPKEKLTEDPFKSVKKPEPVKLDPPKEIKQAKPEPAPKRIKIAKRQTPKQNPIPAPTNLQLPQVKPQAPAIASRPTQYVRPNVTPAPPSGIPTGTKTPVQAPKSLTQPMQNTTPVAPSLTPGMGQPQGTAYGTGADGKAAALEEIRRRYEQTISQWIAKHKVYPAGALLLGQHGEVIIRLRIDRAGNVKYSSVERSSGYKLIDRAAIDMVRRANPVPAVPSNYPPGALLEFLIPARFDLQ